MYRCIKCGSDEISYKHKAKGEEWRGNNLDDEFVKTHYEGHTVSTVIKEYLACKCGLCEYTWRENTMDNRGEDNA